MPPTAEVTAKVSPDRSYPEPFRVTGPLLSLVFRTEDVWQRCNQSIETAEFLIKVSPSHSYNADKAGLGWMSGCKCTLPAGIVLCIAFVTMLPDTVDDSSTSTRCLYLSPSQLCLIKQISNFKVLSYLNFESSPTHTHTHTRTRPEWL